MNAGLNVLCIGAQANYPMGCDPEAAQEIDELARANGVTFTGGGAWDHCRVWPGILAASACTDIKKLLHTSFTNVGVNKAEMFRDGTCRSGIPFCARRRKSEFRLADRRQPHHQGHLRAPGRTHRTVERLCAEPRRRCDHFLPTTIPLLLEPNTRNVLPRTGTQTGQLAMLELISEDSWGGMIAGDAATIHWDRDCDCGRHGPLMEPDSIRRI
jgi:hypothetical protein